eukprot:4939483-Pleurochrysis_carterae.AAC.1
MSRMFAMIRSWGNLRHVPDICLFAGVAVCPEKYLGHLPGRTKSAESDMKLRETSQDLAANRTNIRTFPG